MENGTRISKLLELNHGIPHNKIRSASKSYKKDHTLKHFRQELWFPRLLDRNFWDKWFNEGKTDMRTRCMEMKNKILKEHVPEPLDKDTKKEVDKLLKKAEEHFSN